MTLHVDLILIRHAESIDDRDDIVDGSSDFSLTPRGHEQARLLGECLARECQLDALYCGDTKRTVETAASIADRTDLTTVVEPLLTPHNIGLDPGITQTEAASKYPHIWCKPVGVYDCLPGGEPYATFHHRVTGAIMHRLEQHEEETLCIVTHGLIINAFYRHFCRYSMERRHELSIMTSLASIHQFSFRHQSTFRQARRRILRINDTSHLSPARLSPARLSPARK